MTRPCGLARFGLAAAGILAALTASPRARAANDDGVYGRFDGDLELRAEAGAAIGAGGPALAAGAAALYLGMVGIYLHYTDALGGRAPHVARSIATGVHWQPLFLARYASGLERGPAHLDLFLDSFGLELGAFWDAPRDGPIRPRAGFDVALAAALPILPRATGPYLGVRAALRWRAADLAGTDRGVVDRGAVVSLTLGWHHVVRARLVDPGDGLVR